MSKYTITIKNLIKNGWVFKLNEYPIFDENYREVLNSKILNHYFMNEIGLETPALFNHYLDTTMKEIMPYYNILYEKQLRLLNKLDNNVDLTETFTRNVDNTTSSNTSSSVDGKTLFQDTPQGRLVQAPMDQQDHATNINLSKSSDTASSSYSGNSTEDYIKRITGNNGKDYNIRLLNDIKNNIMNIDLEIINKLNDLFMGLL